MAVPVHRRTQLMPPPPAPHARRSATAISHPKAVVAWVLTQATIGKLEFERRGRYWKTSYLTSPSSRRLQSQFLMLLLGQFLVAGKPRFIPPAAHPFEDHGEGPAIARRRAVRLGPMDRHAVMGDDVAGG